MAATVTVQDQQGQPFRCTRLQWERIHEPAGLTLLADENGQQPRSKKATRKADRAETQETDS